MWGSMLSLMRLVATPLSQWIPVDSVAGIATANIVALITVVVACFLAGLIARSDASFLGRTS